jgi:putative ATP-dependent endonuclease of OLD family
VVVEGDTEHTAFSYIRENLPDEFRDVHVIRARGKATIVSLMKILNHFGADYSVLHDCDARTARRKDGSEIANSAWTENLRILEESEKSTAGVKLVASVVNFETAFFDEELSSEKPYTALSKLRTNKTFFDRVYTLLKYLVGDGDTLPDNAIHWGKEEDLADVG